jgi:hypothetical protein
MTPLASLWLPILLSAVAVFIVSSIVHMVLPHHRTDFGRLPAEDETMRALAQGQTAPGTYMFPYAGSMAAMKDPAWVEKRTRGPAGIVTIMAPGAPGMSKNLIQWFIYSIVVSLFAAYIASRALSPGAVSGQVLRFTAATAFFCYGVGIAHESVWFSRRWSVTFKYFFDALLYAFATGFVFVWLWPKA